MQCVRICRIFLNSTVLFLQWSTSAKALPGYRGHWKSRKYSIIEESDKRTTLVMNWEVRDESATLDRRDKTKDEDEERENLPHVFRAVLELSMC